MKFSITQKAIVELVKKFVPMLQNISSHSKKDEIFYEIKYAFDNDKKIDRRMAKDPNYNPPRIRNISKKNGQPSVRVIDLEIEKPLRLLCSDETMFDLLFKDQGQF